MRKALTLTMALAALTACGGGDGTEEAAAKACTLFEDTVNGFLVMAEDGAEFEPATVRAAIADAAGELDDAVDAAPSELVTEIRDAQDLVELYAQAQAVGRTTDDVGVLMFRRFNDVRAACTEAGTKISFPPSFNS